MLARAACRFLRQSSSLASGTSRPLGPVGLPPNPNARHDLLELYEKTLLMTQQIPKTALYRTNVENLTHYRKSLVEETEDIIELEEKLGLGRIEEVIEQAQDELHLLPAMIESAPWEVGGKAVGESSPPKIKIID